LWLAALWGLPALWLTALRLPALWWLSTLWGLSALWLTALRLPAWGLSALWLAALRLSALRLATLWWLAALGLSTLGVPILFVFGIVWRV